MAETQLLDGLGRRVDYLRMSVTDRCDFRCVYCMAEEMTFLPRQQILGLEEIARLAKLFVAQGVKKIRLTGGEPLAQKRCHELLTRLCDAGYEVSLETSGALDVAAVDARVVKVVDVKTPSSAESERNLLANFDYLQPTDQLKFVIGDQADYQWSCAMVESQNLAEKCTVLFSPVADALPAATLADWVLRDRLPVRFQLQLHKTLWGNTPGR